MLRSIISSLKKMIILRCCFDGLTNYCTDNMIYETVFGNNLDEAIKQLIAFANECGGKDNITAAVIAN